MQGYRSICENRNGICYKIARQRRQLDFDRKKFEYLILQWLNKNWTSSTNSFIPHLFPNILPSLDLPQIAYVFIPGTENVYNDLKSSTIVDLAINLTSLHEVQAAVPKELIQKTQLLPVNLFEQEIKNYTIKGGLKVQALFAGYKQKLYEHISTFEFKSKRGDDYKYFVHGDLKPQNLILKADGKLSLIDFEDAYITEGVELELALLFGNCMWTREQIELFTANYKVNMDRNLLNCYLLIKRFSKIAGDLNLEAQKERGEISLNKLDGSFKSWHELF